jgi:hypothetical protein
VTSEVASHPDRAGEKVVKLEGVKKPGVCYAMTDEGVELPVVDITHPAFAVGVVPSDMPAFVDESARSLEQWSRVPAFVRNFVARDSVLMGGGAAAGGFMSGMTTYLHKLGPDNLVAGLATPKNRRAAGTITSVAVRLRLRMVATLIAESLIAALVASETRSIDMINIGGGTAADTLNALILTQAERPELLAGRRISIRILDLDEAGARFGGRALAALLAPGAPLDSLSVTLDHVAYDWSDTSVLADALATPAASDAIAVGSSEGGLFEYGSEPEIAANLWALRQATPDDFAIVGTMFRDARVGRIMKDMSPLGFILRDMEPFTALVGDAGWRVDRTVDDNPVYHVFRLRKTGRVDGAEAGVRATGG